MVPSTMYANAILPVPWTVAQREYIQRPRRQLPAKPNRLPVPKLPQDREAAFAAKRIESLLTAARTAVGEAGRLLADIRFASRPFGATASQLSSIVSEMSADIVANTRLLVDAYNDLQLRFEAAGEALLPKLRQTFDRLMDVSIYDWLGIRPAEDGSLAVNESLLRDCLQAHDEPINISFVTLAGFATQIGKAGERLLDEPSIRLLHTQTNELQSCTAYRATKQTYLLLPLKGLLVNAIG
ncbi:hypothetical protein [Cohnella sp. GCM10027633]|uniref:hypothetical protein n=1 Tax=unclassified Cohnella TaxID=2636738 RepID=UPI00363DDD14